MHVNEDYVLFFALGIFLGHLKISVEDICRLVLNVDHSKFSTSHIKTMISCFPDDNEVHFFKQIITKLLFCVFCVFC